MVDADAESSALIHVVLRLWPSVPILHVEDDASFALVFSELMAEHGQESRHVVNTTDAWDALRKEQFTILCDQRLPDGSGLELLRRLRHAGRADPFILVTGLMDDTIRRQALAEGADGVIEKGVNLHTLEEQVLRAISQTA